LFAQQPVSAATIQVADDCSLVDAIETAHTRRSGSCASAGDGEVVIELTEDIQLTRVNNTSYPIGPNGLPLIETAIRIEGNGHEISRQQFGSLFRFFQILPSGTLTLNDLSLRYGNVDYYYDRYEGGAIFNEGTLVVQDSRFIFNQAAYDGGAVQNEPTGVMTVNGSYFMDNVGYRGGAINNRYGSLTVSDSTMTKNKAVNFGSGSGGAISNFGDLVIDRSHFTKNRASGSGGGIMNWDEGLLLLTNSTITGNIADDGGGLYVRRHRNDASGFAVIANTTISVNETDDGTQGAGVASIGSRLTLVNSTIFGNSSGGGLYARDFNGRIEADVQVIQTTFAQNEGYNIGTNFTDPMLSIKNSIMVQSPGAPNCVGELQYLGGNFASDATCGNAKPIAAGVDLSIVPANNGGPTETLALLPGSVAINGGVECGQTTDQRGFARDSACDSGAFELDASEPPPLSLEVSGICPGDVTVTVTDATPNGSVILAWSPEPGLAGLREGPCVGAVLQLDGPERLDPLATDGDGMVSLSRNLLPERCGVSIQAMDLTTCSVSSVEFVPGP